MLIHLICMFGYLDKSSSTKFFFISHIYDDTNI